MSQTVYEPGSDCQPDAIAYVGGLSDANRIPLVNRAVKLEYRKDGPLSLQGTANVYFPAIGPYGDDWLSVANDHYFDICDIVLYDRSDDSYHHAFRGVIQGIGPGTTTRNEMRMRVVDSGLLLSEIPVGDNFNFESTDSTDLQRALNRVADEVEKYLPFDTVDVPDPGFSRVRLKKRYKPNRHSLKTVISDILKKSAGGVFFDARGGKDRPPIDSLDATDGDSFNVTGTASVTLADEIVGSVAEKRISLLGTAVPVNEYSTSSIGGGLRVINDGYNNLLAEINPVNAVRLKGATDDDGADFPEATAYHPRLVNIVGNRIVNEGTSAETRLDPLKTEAKNRLKSRLDTAGFGSAPLVLKPQIRPYDLVTIPFNCNSNVDPLQYEIERVTHHAGILKDESGQRRVPKTEIQCSIATPLDEIEAEGSYTNFKETTYEGEVPDLNLVA